MASEAKAFQFLTWPIDLGGPIFGGTATCRLPLLVFLRVLLRETYSSCNESYACVFVRM
jgi:hypothetical protein